MTERLNAIFQLIPKEGRGVIDIGTDHGIIPISLAESSYQGNIFASDIKNDPLQTAIKSAELKNVNDRIHFMLADGLEHCSPRSIDCIIVAGMGGDTICSILDRAEWLYDFSYRLILQPMTRPEVLRYWLVHNEFQIDQEVTVCEGSKIYQVVSAFPGSSVIYTDAEYLVGKAENHRDRTALRHSIDQQIDLVCKKLDGLKLADDFDSTTLSFYTNILQELENMKNECKDF